MRQRTGDSILSSRCSGIRGRLYSLARTLERGMGSLGKERDDQKLQGEAKDFGNRRNK